MATLRALSLLACLLGLLGCELVADFDRSKIPRMRADGGLDASAPEEDASTSDDSAVQDPPVDDDDAGDPDADNDAG
jgi:hypothetical protein